VLFFLVNWGKTLPSSAEAQSPQEEFLTPIRQTVLLYEHEGRLHPVTNAHYYKMWVQFTSPHSIEEWICYFFTNPHSLQLMNWLKIQWNHLVYQNTFCCNAVNTNVTSVGRALSWSVLKAWVMKAAVELCVENWSVVWLNVSRYWTLY
jgi:hypothetical protein